MESKVKFFVCCAKHRFGPIGIQYQVHNGITSGIKQKFDAPYKKWKEVDNQTKDLWFQEFEVRDLTNIIMLSF